MAVPTFTTAGCAIVLMTITKNIVLSQEQLWLSERCNVKHVKEKNVSHSTRDVAVILFAAKSLYSTVTGISVLLAPQPEIDVDAIQQAVVNNKREFITLCPKNESCLMLNILYSCKSVAIKVSMLYPDDLSYQA